MNWVATTLAEVRKNETQRASTDRSGDPFELWSVPAFGAGRPEIVRGSDIGSTKQTVVPGTVLVCKINPRINRIWVVGPRTAYEQIASTEWIPFFPVPGLEPRFLQYYLQREAFRSYLASNVSGVGGSLMRVRAEVIERFPLPLPPHEEQRRIVAAIEEHLSHLDVAVAALERMRAALPRYRAAVLKAACEGRLVETGTGAAEWAPVTVKQISKEVSYGSSAKTSETSSGVPVLRMGNIVDGTLDLESLKFLPQNHDEFPDLLLAPGDVLFNRTNSPELVGKTAVYRGTPAPCSFASYLIRVRLANSCLPDFLSFTLNSAVGRRWIGGVVSQQVGQANVSGGKRKDFSFGLPPLPDQQLIVAEVDHRLSLADAADRAVSAGLAKAKRLRQAILKRAFEGRLVPQDPNDEPASVLLERIRAATPALSRTRKSATKRR